MRFRQLHLTRTGVLIPSCITEDVDEQGGFTAQGKPVRMGHGRPVTSASVSDQGLEQFDAVVVLFMEGGTAKAWFCAQLTP